MRRAAGRVEMRASGWTPRVDSVPGLSVLNGAGAAPGVSIERAAQRLLSMKAVNWDLETAPTLVASTSPPRKSIRVGMPRMP